MMSYNPEDKNFVLELTYDYGIFEYEKGNAYAQIAIGTDDVYKIAEGIKLYGGKITRSPGSLSSLDFMKITSCLDLDGWRTVFIDNIDFLKESKNVQSMRPSAVLATNMAQASTFASKENAIEWVKNDERRMLHIAYHVRDLDKFYTDCLGMKLLRKRDIPEERHTNAFLGYGSEDSHFVLKLTYSYDVDKYDIGTGFVHIGIAVENVPETTQLIKANGGKVTRERGPPRKVVASAEDPDGYEIRLFEKAAMPKILRWVILRVGDLDRAKKFYEMAFGMKLVGERNNVTGMFISTIVMTSYGRKDDNGLLGLQYDYWDSEFDKGNAYAQIAIGTDDVYRTAEGIKLFDEKITREPRLLPGINTKIIACLDPDGWKTVFVGNNDFLKELK